MWAGLYFFACAVGRSLSAASDVHGDLRSLGNLGSRAGMQRNAEAPGVPLTFFLGIAGISLRRLESLSPFGWYWLPKALPLAAPVGSSCCEMESLELSSAFPFLSC